MAGLEKRNVLELIDAVGALIDIVPTDSTTPSMTQVAGWLNEGVINVFRLVPIGELQDSYIYVDTYGYVITEDMLENKMMRVVNVERNEVECVRVTNKEIGDSVSIDPMRFSFYNPAYTIKLKFGKTSVVVTPVANAFVSLTYVPYPFIYVLPDDGEDAETPDSTAAPSVLEELVIEYAALKYRIQDEEPAQYKMYLEDWMNKVKLFYSLPADQVEGS